MTHSRRFAIPLFLSVSAGVAACSAADGAATASSEDVGRSSQALTLPTNLIVDDSFEKQTTSSVAGPWSASSGASIQTNASPPHGVKNALVPGTTGWNFVQQWVAVQPFTHYTTSIAVATSSNLTSGYFSARGDVTFAVMNQVAFDGSAGTGWRTLRFEFDSGSNTSVLLYAGFWGNGANATLRVDDATVIAAPSLVANGSFESGLSPWFGGAVETTGQQSGSGAALVTGTSGWLATNQWLTVAANTSYHVTAWVRTSANVNAGYFAVRGNPGQTSFDVIDQVPFGPLTGSYQLLAFDFDSGANTSVLLYAGYWAPGAASQIEVDDVAVTLSGNTNAYYECEHLATLSTGVGSSHIVPLGSAPILEVTLARQPGLPASPGTGVLTLDGVVEPTEFPEAPNYPSGTGFASRALGAVTATAQHTATLVTSCGTESQTLTIDAVPATAPTVTSVATPNTVTVGEETVLSYGWSTLAVSTCYTYKLEYKVTRANGTVFYDGPPPAVTRITDKPPTTTTYTMSATCTSNPALRNVATAVVVVSQPARCGDGACNGGETCSSCPGDCGSCGGSACQAGQSPQTYAFCLTNPDPTDGFTCADQLEIDTSACSEPAAAAYAQSRATTWDLSDGPCGACE